MRIGDGELDAAQSPPGQLSKKLSPDCFGLGCADLHAEHFPSAIGVDAHRDDDRDRDDPATAPDLQIGRIDPQIGPLSLDGPVKKGLHLVVDLIAQPGYLALGDARHAHGFDEIIDGACRDALDVGLLDDRSQGFLRHAAWLKEAREITACAKLRNAQLDCACPCLPVSVAIAVALGQAANHSSRHSPRRSSPTSSAISFSAAKPIISRSKSASALFSTRERRFIMSSVIGGVLQVGSKQPDPTGKHW
jgi:hypothetical protein